MTALLTNRDGFTPPADGYFHIAPLGEFAHAQAGVTQVLDAAACESIVNRFKQDAAVTNFAGLLVDFDHCSLDGEKRTEAAGWITDLQNRDTGLFAKIRWTDLGDTAVKGGRYRFLSPVWARADCEDLGNNRLRPLRLLNAAVTNDPNLKGMRPMSNSTTPPAPVDSSPKVEPPVTTTQNLKWTLGNSPQDRHCPSCQALANQVHTMEAWDAAELYPQSAKLFCKGNCHCSLTPTTDAETGSLDSVKTLNNSGWTDQARAAALAVRRMKAAVRRAQKGSPLQPPAGTPAVQPPVAHQPQNDDVNPIKDPNKYAWGKYASVVYLYKTGRRPVTTEEMAEAEAMANVPPRYRQHRSGALSEDSSDELPPEADSGGAPTIKPKKPKPIKNTLANVGWTDAARAASLAVRRSKSAKRNPAQKPGDPPESKNNGDPIPPEDADLGDADPTHQDAEKAAARDNLFRDATGTEPAEAHQRAKDLRKRQSEGEPLSAEDEGFLDLYDDIYAEDTLGNRTLVDFLREVEGDNMTAEELTNALAHERLQNAILINQVIEAEDAIVNRDLQDFDAFLSNETRAFWREQLLTNRTAALTALTQLSRIPSAPAAAPAPAAPAADPPPQPLHNRAAARPVIPPVVAPGPGPDSTDRAAKIRNRAHELVRAERIPFQSAFRRAENELASK